jgi:uncharacterized repeat protein (TIGR01451 family)
MEQNVGTPGSYLECYQWFIAPTRIDGSQPRPDLAPDVINNSWYCPPDEGCTDPLVMLAAVEAVRAAGILTVNSAGNSGPSCSTINSPAAIYDASFTVGNTTITDAISNNSSRGPVTVDGSSRLKPDVSAPGTGILSSYPPNGYTYLSGTSMSAPHVAGLAALVIQAAPALRGQVGALEALIARTAVPLTTTQDCGGTAGQVPNNVFGYGRVDAAAAVGAVLDRSLAVVKTVSAPWVDPGAVLTYTLTVQHLHPVSATAGIVLSDTLPAGLEFVTATLPYVLEGSTVRWEVGTLGPLDSGTRQVAVRVPTAEILLIRNVDYGASSSEIAFTPGLPVTVTVGSNLKLVFLPVFARRVVP